MAKQTKNATRAIRLSPELAESADAAFTNMGLTFSEGVRMYLEEVVRTGKLPFRPASENTERQAELAREKETQYVGMVLNRGGTMLKSLLQTLLPENSKDLTDDGLREWGVRTGFPDTMSLTALAELYDSGLFAKDPWSGDVTLEGVSEESSIYLPLLVAEQTQNIRSNLGQAYRTLVNNAINAYINADSDK